MKKVELLLSKTYVYKGKIFEKGKTYGISDTDASHLIAQRNERDVPYFRLTESTEAVAPASKRSDKGGTTPSVVEAEDGTPEPTDEVAEVADDDEVVDGSEEDNVTV